MNENSNFELKNSILLDDQVQNFCAREALNKLIIQGRKLSVPYLELSEVFGTVLQYAKICK